MKCENGKEEIGKKKRKNQKEKEKEERQSFGTSSLNEFLFFSTDLREIGRRKLEKRKTEKK